MLENKRINATLFAKIKIFMKKPALPSSAIPEERNFNRENNIMKVSKKQQKIQKKINQLLLAGIPLATLIPLQVNAQAPENKGIPLVGVPVRPIKTNIKVEIIIVTKPLYLEFNDLHITPLNTISSAIAGSNA